MITRAFNGRYEGWHPTLGEFDLKDPRSGNPRNRPQGENVNVPPFERFSETDVFLKIKDIAPLTFESTIKVPESSEKK